MSKATLCFFILCEHAFAAAPYLNTLPKIVAQKQNVHCVKIRCANPLCPQLHFVVVQELKKEIVQTKKPDFVTTPLSHSSKEKI